MSSLAGKDATKKFDKYHRRALLNQYKPRLSIGTVTLDANVKEAITKERGFWKRVSGR